MQNRKRMQKILAALLAAVLAVTATVSALAEKPDVTVAAEGTTVVKVSNPDRGQREVDGLIEGGDRETSYAWCMAARGKYLYIGTNKNLVGGVANSLVRSVAAAGMDTETAWAIADVLTNGEIPRPETTEGGYILRCDCETGEIVPIYTAPIGVSFRMAILFDGMVYFGSYASSPVDANGNPISNDILRIDENDNVDVVFSSYNGTSMRAACIYDDRLYFGGVDASLTLAEGYEKAAKLAVLVKDNNDDSVWNRVADYRDFGLRYAADPAMSSAAASPIWDICAYDDYLYATLPNSLGFAVFKGHPATENETANEYGWYWSEVVGFNNGVNNIALADDVSSIVPGVTSMVATPFVFKDRLYLFDFDNTITSEVQAVQGLVQTILGREVKASDYLGTMVATLQHPQSLWRLNDETGVFEKVEGFSALMEGTTNEYVWRAEEYNGELYITTMDSAVLYNYITRLTNGNFLTMTEEEWQEQLGYAKTLIDRVNPELGGKAQALLETARQMLEELQSMELTEENVRAFLEKYFRGENQNAEEPYEELRALEEEMEDLEEELPETEQASPVQQLKAQLEQAIAGLRTATETLEGVYDAIDWEGLEMYVYISDMVKNDVWGFDMFKTADGEHFELVTNDGFGDRYNYGGRTLAATEYGLFVGTANPFYGAQLYRLNTLPAEAVAGDVNGDGAVTVADYGLLLAQVRGAKVLD